MGFIAATGCEGLTVEGSQVRFGETPMLEPAGWEDLGELLRWADEARTLGVRANCDTSGEAARARKFGAGGVACAGPSVCL